MDLRRTAPELANERVKCSDAKCVCTSVPGYSSVRWGKWSTASPPQIQDAVPGGNHHGNRHGQDMASKPSKLIQPARALVEEQCQVHDVGQLVAKTIKKRTQFRLSCLVPSLHAYQVR